MESSSTTLIRFAYHSRAIPDLQDQSLMALVRQCWQFNTTKRIFGMLEFRNGRFSQVIEGSLREMNTLIPAILADGRHTDIDLAAVEIINSRTFDAWTVTGFDDMACDQHIQDPVRAAKENVIYSDLFGKGGVARSSRLRDASRKGVRPENEPRGS